MLRFFQKFPVIYAALFVLAMITTFVFSLIAFSVGANAIFVIGTLITFTIQWFGLKFYAKHVYNKN